MKVCTPLPGIPLNLFDKARELYRDVRWSRPYSLRFRLRILSYRLNFPRRRREKKAMAELLSALSSGSYSNVMMVRVNPGALKVESLEPTMQVVTFDERYIKLT